MRSRVGGLLALLLGACGGASSPAGGMPAFPPPSVVVGTSTARDVPVYRDEIGKAVASESVDLRPQVTGLVTEVLFRDGADVKVGDPLFTIDPRSFAAKLGEAKARVSAAHAGVTQAQASRDTVAARLTSAKSKREEARSRTTGSNAMADASRGDVDAAQSEATRAEEDLRRFEQAGGGAVSQQELDRVRSAAATARAHLDAARRRAEASAASAAETAAAEKSAESAVAEAEAALVESDAKVAASRAEVEQAEAALATASLDVEHAHVTAPIAGRAGRHMLDVGNLATPQTVLVRIQRIDPIWVEFTVPEQALGAVQASLAKKTLRAEVRLPDEAAFEPRQGEVTYLDDAVQPGTGTVRLRATLANSDARLWPGRFVNVRLVLEVKKNAVLVPAGAVQRSANGPYVFVVKADSTAELRPVVPGQRHGDLLTIDQGLAAGEQVIIERPLLVIPGGKVVVVPPASAATGAPGAQGSPPGTTPSAGANPPAASPSNAPPTPSRAASGS